MDAPARHPRPAALLALSVIIALESLALFGTAAFLLVEIFAAPADSVPSAIALAVVVVIAAIWVAAIARGLWRGQAWTRGAIIVVQLLLAAIAVGSFQGIGTRPDIGWLILIPVVLALALVFSAPVRGSLSRD